MIVSATHGFIDGHALQASRVEEISQDARRQMATLLNGAEIDDIFVAAQSDHLAIIDAHVAAMPLCRVMERTHNTVIQHPVTGPRAA